METNLVELQNQMEYQDSLRRAAFWKDREEAGFASAVEAKRMQETERAYEPLTAAAKQIIALAASKFSADAISRWVEMDMVTREPFHYFQPHTGWWDTTLALRNGVNLDAMIRVKVGWTDPIWERALWAPGRPTRYVDADSPELLVAPTHKFMRVGLNPFENIVFDNDPPAPPSEQPPDMPDSVWARIKGAMSNG